MQAFKFNFQMSNCQLFNQRDVMDFLSDRSKSICVILNKIHLSLGMASLHVRCLFPPVFPGFDHFEVLL